MSAPEKPFFVGYLPVPPGLRGFLLLTAVGLVVLFGILAVLVSRAAEDPGEGAFRFDYGRQVVTGVVQLDPYPLLHVTQGTDRVSVGHTMMLSGAGKFGVSERVAPFAGQLAQVTGIILERGDLDMLQVAGGGNAVVAAEGAVADVVTEPLGRWRLTGEICDGKCLAGAMRPGRGLAHKACANLCLFGDIPPVFVSTQAVEGSEFLLASTADGQMLPPAIYDWVGLFVTAEGEVERRGDLLIFRLDADSIQVAP